MVVRASEPLTERISAAALIAPDDIFSPGRLQPGPGGGHRQFSCGAALLAGRVSDPGPALEANFAVTAARIKKNSVEAGMYQCHSKAEETR